MFSTKMYILSLVLLGGFFCNVLFAMEDDRHEIIHVPLLQDSGFHELAMRAINTGNKDSFEKLFNRQYVDQITQERLVELSGYSRSIEIATEALIEQKSEACSGTLEALMLGSFSCFLVGMPQVVFCLTSGCGSNSVIFASSTLGLCAIASAIGIGIKCKNVYDLRPLRTIVDAQASIRKCIKDSQEDYSATDETASLSDEEV